MENQDNLSLKQKKEYQMDLFGRQIPGGISEKAKTKSVNDKILKQHDENIENNKNSKFRDIDPYIGRSLNEWIGLMNECFSREEGGLLELARAALDQYPTDWHTLGYAAYAAIVENQPGSCFVYLKRLAKRWQIGDSMILCEAIAYAQQNKYFQAQSLVRKYHEQNDYWDRHGGQFVPAGLNSEWLRKWIQKIKKYRSGTKEQAKGKTREKINSGREAAGGSGKNKDFSDSEKPKTDFEIIGGNIPFAIEPLSLQKAKINISYKIPCYSELNAFREPVTNSLSNFLLRLDFAHCALLKGFDELLCIPLLNNVDHYWHQVETARKVLKVFRGRVLLADEVGLGKTIEAGMILKEYILRSMADRVLILAPPSLVGQWQEEMSSKFSIEFITTSDHLFRSDPGAFWKSPRIIASIAAAKRNENSEKLADNNFDIIIVDEAHHLKNRNTKNWKLVDALKKRFLLLLSATPVQNNLVELYNLLTLLKPGIFKTEKDFKKAYMSSSNPRLPANKDELQNLMRDVMIRNTRSLVNVRLPARNVLTVKVDPLPDELQCYRELEKLIKAEYASNADVKKMAMLHFLQAAGSSPLAVSRSLEKYAKETVLPGWMEIYDKYSDIKTTGKIEALFDIIKKNRLEKKIIFVRYRDTLELLDSVLSGRGVIFSRFDGRMSAAQKDESIERFRSDPKTEVLLCTETGGEGRNIQFCNTMINFDLPWNPQAIEQRIGRIHRIGQTREVFVFNLTLKNTIEAQILRILDEKINMFELVVGEIQSILGEMDDEQDFSDIVFSTWLNSTEESVNDAFDALGRKILEAKEQYNVAKALDEELFGEEFEVV